MVRSQGESELELGGPDSALLLPGMTGDRAVTFHSPLLAPV